MIEEIYRYWFGDLEEDASYFQKRVLLWFGGTKEIDAEIDERFGKTLARAILPGGPSIAPEFLKWTETARGTIALIVLIDQFGLQLFREKPESYQWSELVVPITKTAIANGFDRTYSVSEKLFLYLPLEHSENIPDQELAVRLFKEMVAEAKGETLGPARGFLDYAERHARVVKRFGRFPDRNAVFGRVSTPEEEAFLTSDDAPF